MSSITLLGDTSGSIVIDAPAIAGSGTLTLPVGTGTISAQGVSSNIVSRTAVSATGTSIDFTAIPSWVKRITVVFSSVSTNGSSAAIVQLGTASSVETSGYLGSGVFSGVSTGSGTSTVGLLFCGGSTAASVSAHGNMVINNITGNTWVASYVGGQSDSAYAVYAGGSKALSGTLTRLRITTANGTDAFDAGTINILYE